MIVFLAAIILTLRIAYYYGLDEIAEDGKVNSGGGCCGSRGNREQVDDGSTSDYDRNGSSELDNNAGS